MGLLNEKLNIWVIEDNHEFRAILVKVLNEAEHVYCSHAFPNCEEALRILETTAPPEVFLLDIGLPGMSGIEGIRHFKRISPVSHILVLTVFDDNANVFDAICAGASGYLLKDSAPEKYVEAIYDVMDGGAPMNIHIAKKVLQLLGEQSRPRTDYGLTLREKEILQLVIDGKSKRLIADHLYLSFHTVNTHLKNIYSKLQVHNRSGAITKAFEEHILR